MIAPGHGAPLLASRLHAATVVQHPGAGPLCITYHGPGRCATVYFTDAAEGSCIVVLNPYTGRVPHE